MVVVVAVVAAGWWFLLFFFLVVGLAARGGCGSAWIKKWWGCFRERETQWMWLVEVIGEAFFCFFCGLWWWVDVASGGDGGFLLVVAWVVGSWWLWYGW